MDSARPHQENPHQPAQPRKLEQHDPDVQTATAGGAYDSTGHAAAGATTAPRAGDYTSGAGPGFTGGAAGAAGARLSEPQPPPQEREPAGGLVGGGYDSAAAAGGTEGAVNQGGRPIV